MVGPETDRRPPNKVLTDPEDPRYVRYFGRVVRELGKRYDGHPDMESIDLSIIGAWGEGEGSAEPLPAHPGSSGGRLCGIVPDKTPLVMLLSDEQDKLSTASRKRPVGWRVDCLGDMGGFNPNWNPHATITTPRASSTSG